MEPPTDDLKSEWHQGVCDPEAFKIDHLQPVKLILFQNFTTLLILILGRPIPYYPRERQEIGKGIQPKREWGTGVSVLGAFRLDHLQPVKLILFKNFTNLLICILGRPIPCYPRERGWKWDKGFTQKWMTHRGFSTWGIQTGPFAACWTDFVPKFYHPSDLYSGEANSLLPQREGLEMRKGIHPKIDDSQRLQY